MSRFAFSQRSELESKRFELIRKELSSKCKGLPFAAKVLGSMSQEKHTIERWKNVLKNKKWEIKDVGDRLNPHLLLSYKMKCCYGL